MVKIFLARLVIVIAFLLTAGLLAADTVTDIYQPSYKPASELASALQKIYPGDVKLLAEGGKLIIRGEQGVVNQIQELLLQVDQPSRRFHVEISSQPPATDKQTNHSTNTRTLAQQQYTLVENTPMIMRREQQTQKINHGALLWRPVETAPVQQEYLSLNIRSAQNYVSIDFKWQTLVNGRFTLQQQQIEGPINQWLTISSSRKPATK
ncbi:secretin N-terminal domain-containing protein [Oceanicoccus sp. KOV_DT_Chl]|uniref:secretin N-terminal domain-containing protein n=1 Tax=Oceanicoccus sp. KOV_DT_Chl TaxID=1904639 RepID=UPI000C7D96EE|nr:secretin N-terminal domain-containing protein [Oceanicoccus sp. KOV_DT_Chl]